MDELYDYLERRGINPTTISYFKDEKIDTDTILLIDERELEKWLPQLGDRLAVLNFCKKKQNPENKRKISLLDKLREKINKKPKVVSDDSNKPNSSSTPTLTATSSSTDICTPYRKKHLNKHKKEERMIYLGWLVNETGYTKQVRGNKGGGSRKVYLSRWSQKKDIMEKAKCLFFPKSQSRFGTIDEFDHDLVDFSQASVVDELLTVETMYEVTGMNILRFYLKSTKKFEIPLEIDNQQVCDSNEEEIVELSDNDYSFNNFDYEDSSSSLLPDDVNIFHQVDNTLSQVAAVQENAIVDSPTLYEAPLPNPNAIVDSPTLYEAPLPNPNAIVDSPTLYEEAPLPNPASPYYIHRGHEFKELMEIFLNRNILHEQGLITVKMIEPNGEEERGVDTGGIWRDCLTAFWTTFFDMCTEGTNVKVPVIRHDFQDKHWAAIANILKEGWKSVKYFPLQLSPSFIQHTIFGTLSTTTLKEDYLQYLSQDDANILRNSLVSFPVEEDDFSELLGVLEGLGSKVIPKQTNLDKLLDELAHRDLIQRPQYIITCWKPVLEGLFDSDRYNKLLKEGKPTTKNILKSLFSVNCDHDVEQKNVYEYLKRYIKEADDKTRALFLRFCTGSNIVTSSITITFTKSSQFNRTPVGHVCGSLLELPYPYESFQDFRKEFNLILSSNVWVMDVV